MKSQHVLPTDVFAIKDMGLNTWRKSAHWPISEEQFDQLSALVLDLFDQLHEAVSPEDQQMLLCDFKFVGILIDYLHGLAVSSFCQREGIQLMVGSISTGTYAPDWGLLSDEYIFQDPSNKFFLGSRSVAKTLLYQGSGNIVTGTWTCLAGSDIWSLGSLNRTMLDYLVRSDKRCIHHYIQTILKSACMPIVPSASASSRLMAFSGMLDALGNKLRINFGINLNPQPIRDCWEKRLSALSGMTDMVRHLPRLPNVLLVGEPANPFHKAIAVGCRYRGTKVVAFYHGNDPGNLVNRTFGYNQAATYNEFVCPTAASARLYQKSFELAGLSKYTSVEFTSVETLHFSELFMASSRHRRKGGRKKKAMLVGFPMNAKRYILSRGDFFFFQLEIELQLLGLLRKSGYQTVYKVHPERSQEARGLYDGHCDDLLETSFERVWQQADIIVFGSITTSTFGFTACLPRPMLAVEMPGLQWNDSVKSYLAHRCCLVPAHYDSSNRPYLNREILELQLEAAMESDIDYSYAENFLFPHASQ